MLDVVVHVPVDEGADGVDVARARVEPVVEDVVLERRVLENPGQDEVPSAQLPGPKITGTGLVSGVRARSYPP